MIDLVAVGAGLAATEMITSGPQQLEINWSIVGPLVVYALGTVGTLAYMFGIVNQKIQTIYKDLERVQEDLGGVREQNRDTDRQVHDMALMLSKIDARIEILLSGLTASPHNTREKQAQL